MHDACRRSDENVTCAQGRKPPTPSLPVGLSDMQTFHIQDPSTWYCLRTTEYTCSRCHSFIQNVTACHVLLLHIDSPVEKGKKKVARPACLQFCAVVNGLVNTREGGSVAVHLDTKLHGQFLQQVSDKLHEMLPRGCLYNHIYSHTKEQDHIYFSVASAGMGGRPVSTFDLNIKLPRDVGLKPASQEEIHRLMQKTREKPDTYPFTPLADPTFVKGRALPATFGETQNRQMKAVLEKDVEEKAEGEDRAEKFANYVLSMIMDYICAFATLPTGGWIYLGLSEEKNRPDAASCSTDREKGVLCTGCYVCDGVELDANEKRCFEDRLRKRVNEQTLKYLTSDPLPDIVTVEYADVESPEGKCIPNLHVVKIKVKNLHGLLWPNLTGPLAFRVTRKELQSEVVRVDFHQWVASMLAT